MAPELAVEISDALVRRVTEAVRRGRRVHRRLPRGGRLSIDRKLPYLVLYRFAGEAPDPVLFRLAASESCYLVAPDDPALASGVRKLVASLAELLTEEYRAFLLLELRPGEPRETAFVINSPGGAAHSTVEKLNVGLKKLQSLHGGVDVAERTAPSGLASVLTAEQQAELGVLTLGLEVPPLFHEPESRTFFPVFYRRAQPLISRALRQAFYDFIRVQTTCDLTSAYALGRRSIGAAERHIDRRLAQIEASFQFLLLVLPVNPDQAWEQFRSGGCSAPPHFHYRLLPVDPDALKRRLYEIDLDRVDDPVLAQMFREKREELDIQITMLAERGTARFLYSSIRLYEGVEPELLETAEAILREVPAAAASGNGTVDAETFRRAAEAEYAAFREVYPGFASRIEIRSDLVGLMVSEGNLLIPRGLRLLPERLEALIQHEVGTHVLTFNNGRAQPFRQLRYGLDNYDELQEGLGVLAEYLVGGLTPSRMRLLAARVVAAHRVLEGAELPETYRELTGRLGFPPRAAFDVATRVYAGGGFIKDVIYLRGLLHLLAYLRAGHPVEPLYTGKIALKHVPVIEELRHRQIVRDPPLLPRCLQSSEGRKRLERLRNGAGVLGLLN
ncbi:MAG: flavohemoglobin expression-modulating QEGLA motif protein [Armatimonadota bacterium]